MSAAAKYGLVMGLITGPVLTLGNPTARAVFWFLLSLHLLLGAFIVWKRLRLPYSTAAMLSGSATLLIFGGWSLTGQNVFDRPWPELLAVAVLLVDGPILFWMESRRRSDRWEAWGRAVESASLRDMLLFRHIPQL